MPRYLAVYTMKPEDLARFRSLPKPEQDAIDAVGLKQWADWEERNAASFPDRGGMLRVLKHQRGLQVAATVQPRREAKVPLEPCARSGKPASIARALPVASKTMSKPSASSPSRTCSGSLWS